MRDEDFLALQQAKREKKKLKKLGRTEEDGTADASAPADEQKSAVVAAPAAEPNDPGLTPKKKRERDVAGSSTTESGSQPSGFVDKTITCIDCSSDFIFSAAEQQFFLDQQWTGGKSRCKTCTAAKKARFGEAAGKGTAAAKRAASTTCFICGVTGHKSKDCSQATCYNCGKGGHQSKDCPEPRKNQAGGGTCFKFQSGQCTRGASCRFAHVLDSV